LANFDHLANAFHKSDLPENTCPDLVSAYPANQYRCDIEVSDFPTLYSDLKNDAEARSLLVDRAVACAGHCPVNLSQGMEYLLGELVVASLHGTHPYSPRGRHHAINPHSPDLPGEALP